MFGTSRGPISISQHHGRTSTSQHHGQTPTSTICLNSRQPNCLPQWQTTQPSAYIVHSQPSTASFSKSSNSQTIASEHDIIYTPAPFLSGIYYDNCDCHILCA